MGTAPQLQEEHLSSLSVRVSNVSPVSSVFHLFHACSAPLSLFIFSWCPQASRDSSSCGPETKSSNTDLPVKGFLFRKIQLSRETKHLKCGGFTCVGKKKETESKMEQRRKRNRSDEEKV